MSTLIRKATAVCAAVVLAAAVAPVAAASPAAQPASSALTTSTRTGTAIGLSVDGRSLSVFALSLPALALPLGRISGLSGDSRLVGIDYRVQDNTVYGVGNRGGIYTFGLRTTKATKVSQLTVPLAGVHFGVDFNPAADRLRVISDTGQNLRHNVNAGGVTLVDVPLTLNGAAATGVTAAAYINNDLSASTATVLYDIDTRNDTLVEQTPANDGTLKTLGALRTSADSVAGFDIATTVDAAGVATGNAGFVTLRSAKAKNSTLYKIDLGTGRLQTVGRFLFADVADLAIVQPR
ncbi:MAG: DUF4394 domain-containing protein [Nakamurella sp.]